MAIADNLRNAIESPLVRLVAAIAAVVALIAAERFSPITAVAPEGTTNFDCWVSNTMLVLDTAGRYAIAADAAKDRGEWYRLLRLIRHYHGRDPMNGLII